MNETMNGAVTSAGAVDGILSTPHALYARNRGEVDGFVQALRDDLGKEVLAVALLPPPRGDAKKEGAADALKQDDTGLYFLLVTENVVPLDQVKVAVIRQRITRVWTAAPLPAGANLEIQHRSGLWEQLYLGNFDLVRRIRSAEIVFDPERCLGAISEATGIAPASAKDMTARTAELCEKYKEQLAAFTKDVMAELKDDVRGVAVEAMQHADPDTGIELQGYVFSEHLSDSVENTERAKRRDKLLNAIKTRSGLNGVLSWRSCCSEMVYIQNIRQNGFSDLQQLARASFLVPSKFLLALRACTFHCERLVAKFERYIVCYAMSGSMMAIGPANAHDVDVFLVVDDTDVKQMTREELKEKLRDIAGGMAAEVCKAVAPDLSLNVQVYLLTDYWDSLRDANPIIFTLLRDAAPFYDRGLLRPWQHLLSAGQIRPCQEAVEKYMKGADSCFEQAQQSIRELALEKLFYAGVSAAQAVLMSRGFPPPTPRETIAAVREQFVATGKLDAEVADILEKLFAYRKAFEHDTAEKPTGAQIGTTYDRLKGVIEKMRACSSGVLRDRLRQQSQDLLTDCIDCACRIGADLPHAPGPTDLPTLLHTLQEAGRAPRELVGIAADIQESMARIVSPEATATPDDAALRRTHQSLSYVYSRLSMMEQVPGARRVRGRKAGGTSRGTRETS